MLSSSFYPFILSFVPFFPLGEEQLLNIHPSSSFLLHFFFFRYLVQQAGFLEMLMNRRVNGAYEQLQWKISMAEALVRDTTLGLDAADVLRLKGFLRDGLRVAVEPATAIDTSDM